MALRDKSLENLVRVQDATRVSESSERCHNNLDNQPSNRDIPSQYRAVRYFTVIDDGLTRRQVKVFPQHNLLVTKVAWVRYVSSEEHCIVCARTNFVNRVPHSVHSDNFFLFCILEDHRRFLLLEMGAIIAAWRVSLQVLAGLGCFKQGIVP